ncbi:MAG: pirin family protein [Fluviicola sp.]
MENSKDDRRGFLGKLFIGGSTLVALPFLANSMKQSENDTKEKEDKMKHPVNRVRPLGFQWETRDPFLFCVHHEDKYPKGNEAMGPDPSYLEGRQMGQDFLLKDGFRMYHGQTVPGFPGHPHRGFETITVVREGLVDHADSTGAAGRYGNGDVQWMTAGKGVQHSEMFPLLDPENENPLELFQIWLNLPKRSKMVEPHFKMLWSESVPVIEHMNGEMLHATIEVLAGKLKENVAPSAPPDSWANPEENEVAIYNIQLEPNGSFELPAASEGVNRTLYYYEGNDLIVNEMPIPNYHAAEVDETQALTLLAGNEVSKILVLQGKPINEPVVQHGPFVMNTRAEIQQTFEEYHATQFGGWPWSRYDQVHDREKGRFALHSDGTEEIKS